MAKSNLFKLYASKLSFLISLSILGIGAKAQRPDENKDFRFENVKFSIILDSISKTCKINFSYNADLPEIKKNKSFCFTGTCTDAINQLVVDQDLSVKMLNNQIVLYKSLKNDSIPIGIVSQPIEKFKFIKGTIFDKKEKLPLSFASVAILGKNIGTVANTKGEFIIRIPSQSVNDSLVFSYIGYKRKYIPIDSINSNDLKVELEEKPTPLKTVFIKPVNPLGVIKDLLNNVEKNYIQKNALCTGFYRETIKQDNDYISISEAVVDVSKSPYSGYSNDQARLYKCRKSENSKKVKRLAYKLEGGIYNCLQLDIVKERISFISPESFDLYDYTYLKTVSYNGMNLFVINFDQRANIELPLFKGSLYIDADSKALVAAKFELSPRGIKYAQDVLVKKQPRKYSVEPKSAKYLVYYKLLNDKWILDYTRAELNIKAKSDRLFFNSVFNSVSEMVITAIDTTTKVRFRTKETVKLKDAIEDYNGVYDDNFWGNYNIIEPEESIIDAIKRLNLGKDEYESKSFLQKLF